MRYAPRQWFVVTSARRRHPARPTRWPLVVQGCCNFSSQRFLPAVAFRWARYGSLRKERMKPRFQPWNVLKPKKRFTNVASVRNCFGFRQQQTRSKWGMNWQLLNATIHFQLGGKTAASEPEWIRDYEAPLWPGNLWRAIEHKKKPISKNFTAYFKELHRFWQRIKHRKSVHFQDLIPLLTQTTKKATHSINPAEAIGHVHQQITTWFCDETNASLRYGAR